jgi:hypothetical protein
MGSTDTFCVYITTQEFIVKKKKKPEQLFLPYNGKLISTTVLLQPYGCHLLLRMMILSPPTESVLPSMLSMVKSNMHKVFFFF